MITHYPYFSALAMLVRAVNEMSKRDIKPADFEAWSNRVKGMLDVLLELGVINRGVEMDVYHMIEDLKGRYKNV